MLHIHLHQIGFPQKPFRDGQESCQVSFQTKSQHASSMMAVRAWSKTGASSVTKKTSHLTLRNSSNFTWRLSIMTVMSIVQLDKMLKAGSETTFNVFTGTSCHIFMTRFLSSTPNELSFFSVFRLPGRMCEWLRRRGDFLNDRSVLRTPVTRCPLV